MSRDFSQLAIRAETHPPAYSFHKYWARKPHNVVRRALRAAGLLNGQLVLDPFCGSGVPLSEAARLGAKCVGFDVNPVAVALTRATLDPPEPHAFRRLLESELDGLEREFGELYRLGGRTIRHVVHAVVVVCPHCGLRVSADKAVRRGRRYTCPSCENRLCFNLENLVATRQLRVVLDDGREIADEQDCPAHGEDADACRFDRALTPNRRILAFPGLRTRHLFSARNFRLLTAFAERIGRLPEAERDTASLALTASAAQCSRLIAYRNNLTTGGPAWTVPGFWVPPLHLESNPLAHIRARLQRMCRGFADLRRFPGRGAGHTVRLGSAGELLREPLPAPASLVFLDPPYGDSVPYLEFSALWNSLLGLAPEPAADIAVSDRVAGDGGWDRYERGLHNAAHGVVAQLHPEGRVLVTFNNKDMRAWTALLTALQAAGLACRGAFYQSPAVVSTKAQLAHAGSYIGDVYCLFERTRTRPGIDLAAVSGALRSQGRQTRRSVQRAALLAFLRANLDAGLLPRLSDEIAALA